jgi:hypothetical protein
MATKSSAVANAKKIASKLKTAKKSKSVKRYEAQGQNPPQSKAWTEPNDEGVKAKPIGYRWTTLGAEKLGIKNPTSKPTKQDIEKYRGKTFKAKGETHRYLYIERRVDKSDKSVGAKFNDGGMMAKGGGVKEIDYADVYPILKDKIDNVIDDIPYEYADGGGKGEEVEHESRSGFMPYTDGGYEYMWFEYLSTMSGSGKSLPTKPLDAELDRQVQYNYDLAKENFIDSYPEIVEKLGEDKINYHDLQEAGYESEAEELSEMEMNYDGDDTILMRVFAYYYSPENSRAENGKHTISLFGDVNLESPYHRAGNLDDSMEITFTFNSIADLSKKMDTNLKKIVGWFKGDYYNKSKKEMKIRRMADGGSVKQTKPQSKVYKTSRDKEVEAKPVGWRYVGNNYNEPSANVIKRELKKPRGERKIYFETRKDKSDYDFYSKFKSGGATSFGGRQYDPYRAEIDGDKTAKPVGYRYTDRLAKRLGVSKYKKPTAEHIEKYMGRGVYIERRQDKSDLKPTTSTIYASFKSGGATGFGGRQSNPYRAEIDGNKTAKPVGYRYTDKLAKRLGVSQYKKPTAEHIEKYMGRGVYIERRQDKSDLKPTTSTIYASFEDGGMMARGGVERISNSNAREYSENMIPFMANNLEGKTLSNGDYVVLSYGYYPIWYYCKAENQWYGNSTKYSVTTSKQMSQSRPTYDAKMLTRNELEQAMMKNSAKFENGGMLDGILGSEGNLQNVGGTTFSSTDLTSHMDMNNPNF